MRNGSFQGAGELKRARRRGGLAGVLLVRGRGECQVQILLEAEIAVHVYFRVRILKRQRIEAQGVLFYREFSFARGPTRASGMHRSAVEARGDVPAVKF